MLIQYGVYLVENLKLEALAGARADEFAFIVQPLKLKEYLATGKPCVVRDLPACREWADSLDLADSPESFVAAVKRRLEEGLPESQRLARLDAPMRG